MYGEYATTPSKLLYEITKASYYKNGSNVVLSSRPITGMTITMSWKAPSETER